MTHGTRSSYVRGCKCADCRAANTRYAKLAKYRSDKGISTLVDAAPVKAHLAQLRAAGVGKRTIAQRAGVAQTVVNRLIGIDHSKPARRVHPDTAAKLLAVTAEAVADGQVIDGTGTMRRAQALVAIGWTQADLAARIGWTLGNFNGLVHGRRDVTVGTARLVADLYDRLSMRPGPSQRARNISARYGWAPPLAWDDIDNPAEQPAERRKARQGVPVEDVLELYQAGETIDAIAQRFGLSPTSVHTMIGRARRQVAS